MSSTFAYLNLYGEGENVCVCVNLIVILITYPFLYIISLIQNPTKLNLSDSDSYIRTFAKSVIFDLHNRS
jgi:hypothetical protein